MRNDLIQTIKQLEAEVSNLKDALVASRTGTSIWIKKHNNLRKILLTTGPFLIGNSKEKLSGVSLIERLEAATPAMVFSTTGLPDVVHQLETDAELD